MTKKIGWLGERFCLLCAAVFCGLIVLQSLWASADHLAVVTAAGAVCALAVLWLTAKFWPLGEKETALAVFFLRFAAAMAVILLVGAQPVQDFNTMYTAAQELARGGRSYLENIYFYNWAYQTGFVVYESVLLRLFGPGQFSLQVMNALWLGGIGALVSAIAHRLLPARAANCAAVLYAVYPAPYFLAAVLTNQHIATFFLYLAVYLLVRDEELSLRTATLAGIFIAVGNIMRPIGVVLILAVVCWRVFRVLLRGGANWKKQFWNVLTLVVLYYSVFSMASSAIAWSGINPEGLTNNQPMWKFVLGFNQESGGAWNQADYETYLMLPTEQADAAMRQAAAERLKAGPAALAKLAVRKSAVMWGDHEYMYWGFGHLDGQAKLGPLTIDQYTQILARGDKGVYLTAFALALAGVLRLLRRGSGGGSALLLSFLLCGYYAVHLIVEVQARYRYFLLPTVFLLAGYAMAELENQTRGKMRGIR